MAPAATRRWYSGSSLSSSPCLHTESAPSKQPSKVAGTHTSMICPMPTPNGASSATRAAMAAETGLAVMACCEATTEMLIGRSGRTPVSRETSAITGSSAKAMLPVPDMNVKR